METVRGLASQLPRFFSLRLIVGIATLGFLAAPGSPPGAEAVYEGVPVTVTITEFEEIQDPDPALFQGNGDYYAVVKLGRLESGQFVLEDIRSNRDDHIDGPDPDEEDYTIQPDWQFDFNLDQGPDCGRNFFHFMVEIWDADPLIAAPDDQMDLSPSDGHLTQTTEFHIWDNAADGVSVEAEGDGDTEHTGLFEGGEIGRVEFNIQGGFTDMDGDGIPDLWEENGADSDCDGEVDIDFPAFGAQPDHKDIFIEMDYDAGNPPPLQAVLDVKEAFAKAPIDAGGVSNPDGTPGINLWIDTGGLMEGGVPVGENLGGGNEFTQAPGTICNMSTDGDMNGDIDFYEVKNDNFDPTRQDTFHYAVSTVGCANSPGGQGEQGGNDLVIYSTEDIHYPKTLMHELGHNLNLFHGGFEQDKECKPNYISVMSYDHVPGILWADLGQEGGGEYHVDYSPPRFIDSLGNEGRLGDLPDLDENDLAEEGALFNNNVINMIYTNALFEKVQHPLFLWPDWNGNGANESDPVQVNIDVAENDGTEPDGFPPDCDQYDCDGDTADDCANDRRVLSSHDDWSNISLSFREFTNAADAPGNPPHQTADPNDETAALIIQSLNSTDLEISKSDSVDPVVAGENLTYTLTVTNNGPNMTTSAKVTDTLPAGTTFVSASAGCTESPPGTVECDLGALAAGDSTGVSITVAVDASLVSNAGSLPVAIVNNATVENVAGADGNSANDSANETTSVVAESNLSIRKSDESDPAAAGGIVTYTITVANDGPSDAGDVEVIDTLPAGVTYVSDTDSCVEAPAGTLTCSLGDIAAGADTSFDVTVTVDPALVFDAGGPTTITNLASVSSPLATDPDPSDNDASEDTLVAASADLEIVSFAAVDAPAAILLGDDVDVTLRKVITNNGPSAPMDVSLTRTASAGPGAAVAPALDVASSLALALDEERIVDETFTISCALPGMYTFVFNNSIAPLDGQDSDPDTDNNDAEVSFSVTCVVPVAINILPGGQPNPVVSSRAGFVPVAVLTTEAGEYGLPFAFDATQVIPGSVRFGGTDDIAAGLGATAKKERGYLEDSYELDQITRDGDTDMVMQFAASDTGLEPGDSEACMTGSWLGPSGETFLFYGCGAVRVK